MSKFVIETPPVVALPVAGSDALFPVRRVYCIGRNYAAHAIEMGHDPDREAPFFFQKNPDNLDASGQFPYPPKSSDVHHEVEIAVMLKSGGGDIPLDAALDHVFGYALCPRHDPPRPPGRDEEAGPSLGDRKGLRTLGAGWAGPSRIGSRPSGPRSYHAQVDGELRQEGDLNQMIWKVPEMISYLSEYFELAAGDVILSGTPSGVGPVAKGETLEVEVEGLGSMTVSVV